MTSMITAVGAEPGTDAALAPPAVIKNHSRRPRAIRDDQPKAHEGQLTVTGAPYAATHAMAREL